MCGDGNERIWMYGKRIFLKSRDGSRKTAGFVLMACFDAGDVRGR